MGPLAKLVLCYEGPSGHPLIQLGVFNKLYGPGNRSATFKNIAVLDESCCLGFISCLNFVLVHETIVLKNMMVIFCLSCFRKGQLCACCPLL